MDDDHYRDLLELLGRTDRLWLPIRDWRDNRRVVSQMVMQQDFRSIGLPILGQDYEDDGDRKRHERALNAWERTGLVVITRRRKRRTHWKLADAPYWQLRKVAGEFGYWQLIVCMWSIAAHTRYNAILKDTIAGDSSVAEFQLCGAEPRPKPYEEMSRRASLLEEMLTPGLVLGWIGSASDNTGVTAYALREAGQEVLADPSAHAPDMADFEYAREAEPLYRQGFVGMEREIDHAKRRPNACAVAISAGCWDWYDAPYLRPFTVFTRAGEQRKINSVERAFQKLPEKPEPVSGIGERLES